MPDETRLRDAMAFSADEAAEVLGISRDTFDKYVRPRVRVVHLGRRVLIARAELARYLEAEVVISLPPDVR